MNALNTPKIVSDIMDRLNAAGAPCLLFGGWAHEALGLCDLRPHADIDLVLPARSFQTLDSILAMQTADFEEIALKRFAHKRAFLTHGVMIEVILVQPCDRAHCTWFWGDVRFDWDEPLAEPCVLQGYHLQAVSRRNLNLYRTRYRSIQPWRWNDQDSLLLHPGCGGQG